LQEKPNDLGALALRGMAKYNLGNYQDAEADFNQVVVLDPNFIHSHYYLGLINERRGAYQEAFVRYTNVAKLKPDFAKALASASRVHVRQGNQEMARYYREQALIVNPDVSFEIE
jgi:tetratricopeptide (TPR) repeat protein